VIVPGFGGFIGNYSPASVDRSSGTFFPPVKKISFNRNLNHNDGLLVGRLSEAAGINYGDARSLVEEYAAGLLKKLNRGEKVTIDHIGVFSRNYEGSIQFEPDQGANYFLDSFGLESFRMDTLEGYDVKKRIAGEGMRDPVKRASLRRNLWRAAVIVPLLSIVVAVSLRNDLFRSKPEVSSMNPLLTEEFESNKKALEENTITVPSATETITQAPEEKADVKPEAAPAEETASYSVIAGSFRSEQNAESQAALLRNEGFSPEVTLAPNGFYRVSAIKCSDINTARIKKDSIRAKFPESWVTKN
jgi:nucleoid DNA-binding protein